MQYRMSCEVGAGIRFLVLEGQGAQPIDWRAYSSWWVGTTVIGWTQLTCAHLSFPVVSCLLPNYPSTLPFRSFAPLSLPLPRHPCPLSSPSPFPSWPFPSSSFTRLSGLPPSLSPCPPLPHLWSHCNPGLNPCLSIQPLNPHVYSSHLTPLLAVNFLVADRFEEAPLPFPFSPIPHSP